MPTGRAGVMLFAATLMGAWLACAYVASTPVAAQDDGFAEEMRRKKKREKAIAEGKDPDAAEEPAAPAKPKLPTTAAGWVGTIKRQWNSTNADQLQLVREAAAELKKAIGTEATLANDLADDFKGFKESEADKCLSDALRKSNVTPERLRAVLEENRPLALKAIMNPAYTEADNCRLQPEVDKACAPLFGVWRDPVGYAIEHWKLDLTLPAGQLDGLATLLGDIVPGLEVWRDGELVRENALSYMRAKGASQLDIKQKEYAAAQKILDANDAMKDPILKDEDKAHVRVLNDYRMMLGKGVLTINVQLCKACTGHSVYQEKIGRIGHNIDGHPDGRTPQDRARKAGFAGGVAENCLMGAGDGAAAVWQWYNAAEHHRNMIGNHSIIGVGHSGVYWTQNFSGGRRGQ